MLVGSGFALVTLAAATSALPLPQAAQPGAVRPRNGQELLGARLPGALLTRGATLDEGVVLADLDANGRMDLATVSDTNVHVVLDLDLTRLGAPVVSAVGTLLEDLAAGDFDGDGDLDLVGVRAASEVQLLQNVGGGAFVVGGTVPGQRFAISDLDDDGDLDLATIDVGSLSVSVHRNAGNATFALTDTVPLPTQAASIFCANLAGAAAAPEIVCGTGVASVLVVPNTGGFNFALELPVPEIVTLKALTDFDGDARPDLWAYTTTFSSMSSPPTHTPRILLWSGTSFVAGPVGVGVISLTGFAPGDVDADGDLDVIVSYDGSAQPGLGFPDAKLMVQRNDGTALSLAQTLARRRARGVACADVDGDGRVEVARCGDGEIALYPNLDGSLNSERTHTIPFSWQGTADLDGNGFLDGFSGIGTQLRVLRMTGDQGTERGYTAVSSASCATHLDVDLDGDLDIALGTAPLSLFSNNGSGLFTGTVATYPIAGAPSVLESVDLDGNGASDVLALRTAAGSLETYLVNAGVLGAATSVATGASPAHLRVGDLDLDGDLDVVLPNRASGTGGVALLRNDGLGGLAAPLHQAGGLDSLELDLGDLDQDGDPDVVVRLTSTLQRIYNDGSGGLSVGGSFALPAAVVRLADLDRDGRTDVLAADSSRGNLQWFRSGQGGTFEPLRTHELQLIHPFAPVRLLVRDLDGDGDQDVASTFTWLMNARR